MATVLIENTYDCGHESRSEEKVPCPTAHQSLDDWWDEEVFPLTGDGHPCGFSDNALHEATVTDAPGRPELVGQRRSWEG